MCVARPCLCEVIKACSDNCTEPRILFVPSAWWGVSDLCVASKSAWSRARCCPLCQFGRLRVALRPRDAEYHKVNLATAVNDPLVVLGLLVSLRAWHCRQHYRRLTLASIGHSGFVLSRSQLSPKCRHFCFGLTRPFHTHASTVVMLCQMTSVSSAKCKWIVLD